MAFLTPCFVRIEDPAERKKLIEWLEEIGYEYVRPPKEEVLGNKVICESSYCGTAHDEQTFSTAEYIDAGTSVELFRSLAAMNDENCLEQWFTDGQNWGLCKDKYWAVQIAKWDVEGNDDMLEMAISPQCHKATAEEIVEYFKKREK